MIAIRRQKLYAYTTFFSFFSKVRGRISQGANKPGGERARGRIV